MTFFLVCLLFLLVTTEKIHVKVINPNNHLSFSEIRLIRNNQKRIRLNVKSFSSQSQYHTIKHTIDNKLGTFGETNSSDNMTNYFSYVSRNDFKLSSLKFLDLYNILNNKSKIIGSFIQIYSNNKSIFRQFDIVDSKGDYRFYFS